MYIINQYEAISVLTAKRTLVSKEFITIFIRNLSFNIMVKIVKRQEEKY